MALIPTRRLSPPRKQTLATPAFDLVALYTRAVSGTDLPALRAFER